MAFPIGTLINIVAVVIGSTIGLLFRNTLKEKYKQIVFQAIGLFTIVLGISMAVEMKNPLIVIFAIIIGGLIGELINLDIFFDSFAEQIKNKLHLKEQKFTEGLITAFLLFCIGSMTILGSIQEGIDGDNSLLITKSVLDGFSSIALASTFGIGVLFSIVPMLIFQGGLTILASLVGEFVPVDLISYLSAIGGILILGIGINLLEIKKIKVINLLPSLIIVIVIYVIMTYLNINF